MTLRWKEGHTIKIGGTIGCGTFGEVRYGRVMETGWNVAVKIVDLAKLDDSSSAAMVKKEIACLKRLRHKNIIGILDVKDKTPYRGTWCRHCACTNLHMQHEGDNCRQCHHSGSDHSVEEVRNVLIMVEELGSGGELFGIMMHCGPFDEDLARFYFTQMIAGLSYIHSKNIYHRDLKPENMVLDHHFDLKIVDFGLAAAVSSESGRKLYSGVGSSSYSAPEVFYARELFEGVGYHGGPADIWSVGVILFVMLTGRPPFIRPLVTSHPRSGLKKDKHFIRLLQGGGYDGVSPAARQLLMSIFRLDPKTRPTLEEIKRSRWYNQALPTRESVHSRMCQKSQSLWSSVGKPWMFSVLRRMQAENVSDDLFQSVSSEEEDEEDDESDESDEDDDEDHDEEDMQLERRSVVNAHANKGDIIHHLTKRDDNYFACLAADERSSNWKQQPPGNDEREGLRGPPTLEDSSASPFHTRAHKSTVLSICDPSSCSSLSSHSLHPSPNALQETKTRHSSRQGGSPCCCSSCSSKSTSTAQCPPTNAYPEIILKCDFYKVLTLLEINLPLLDCSYEIRQPPSSVTEAQPALKTMLNVEILDESLAKRTLHARIYVFSTDKSSCHVLRFHNLQASRVAFDSWIEVLKASLAAFT
jgi:serine/threonine protein kinase